jgi:hypothetical protein
MSLFRSGSLAVQVHTTQYRCFPHSGCAAPILHELLRPPFVSRAVYSLGWQEMCMRFEMADGHDHDGRAVLSLGLARTSNALRASFGKEFTSLTLGPPDTQYSASSALCCVSNKRSPPHHLVTPNNKSDHIDSRCISKAYGASVDLSTLILICSAHGASYRRRRVGQGRKSCWHSAN